jgi:hypothetical protein
VSLPTQREQWQQCCEATLDVRKRFGVDAAIDYLVGEKLMGFARSSEGHPDVLAELPPFAESIRQLFTPVEIRAHFARAEHEALIEPDILKGATPNEVEEFKDLIAERTRDRDRRTWVQAMLLRTGN